MNRHASMNRAYRLVWSAVRAIWIPAAEKTRGRGKQAGRTLLAVAMSLGATIAQAGGPTGGQVTAGSGSISQSGALTTITQHSPKLSLTWTSFNIAPQQTVDFVQPSSSSIAVNRIYDTNGTRILGHLDANGQVFLINPNGIVFGPGAQVNVGGLVASTLDLNQTSLDGNSRSFSGNSSAGVINQGTITATPGGYVALLANHVDNRGVISAQLGTVALGAGSAATLTVSDDSLLRVQVDQSVLRSVAENGGVIRADGGRVIMTAGARDVLLASVVNNTGVIEAQTVGTHDGAITLLAGMAAGTVEVGGTLDASAPSAGNGGFIETSAAKVEVASGAKVTTAAAMGLYGSWLIDPQDFTIAASGGDITGAALSSELATTAVVVQSSAGLTAGSGNINVNDPVAWNANTVLTLTAANNVNINANITATGDTAGLVINPRTANGGDAANSNGTYTLLSGASITLSGATPSLSIAGNAYTVINTLGAAGSTTGTDLQGINGNVGGFFALGSNIDASPTLNWNVGAGFTPIGTSGTPFSGTFDGLGHTISNLTINRPTEDYIGLFSVAGSTSVIQNVGLVGCSISGGSYGTGGLVGRNSGSITNSFTTGQVTQPRSTGYGYGYGYGTFGAGGVVGRNYGSISRSHSSAVLNGQDDVGGLVGRSSGGTISNSYATGTVTGISYVGGLVGEFYGTGNDLYATGAVIGSASYARAGGVAGINVGTISNSYATGSVTSGRYAGGFVGVNYGTVSNSYATGAVNASTAGGLASFQDQGTIIDSYSTGAVSGGGRMGGLVGSGYQSTITDSYWNITTSGQTGSYGGGSGLTTAQMQSAANFVGFNFAATPGAAGNNWVMVDSDGSLNNAGGMGGATFPMLASEYSTTIVNAHQLQLMAMALGASYTLAANVNAGATDTGTTLSDVWSTSAGFIPIGSRAGAFTGAINGLGFSISGLTINAPTADDVGLFGLSSGSIENVALLGGSVVGQNNVGGLVGNNFGTIDNSYTTGIVTGAGSVGGLVGNNYGAISASHATGLVTGGNYVGGLIGSNTIATISDSYATGNVSGSGRVGGLVGQNYGNPYQNASYGAISNSYATGTVTAAYLAGGLVGFNNAGTITNSHATGSVAAGGYAGGLVGTNFGTIQISYATGSVNIGGGNNAGGLVGRDGGALDRRYATGAVSGGSYVGGLVGEAATQGVLPITNSYATGTVTGGTNVGGLIGYNAFAVSNDYATGSVSGNSNVGGLIGNNYGSVSNSYATGAVTAAAALVGGLVGSNYGPVSNSYATGSVLGADKAGGLVGANYGVTTSISNSYATGSVQATNPSAVSGGLVGLNNGVVSNSYATGSVSGMLGLVGDNEGSVTDSFWYSDINPIGIGAGDTTGATGLSTAAMMTMANFSSAGWSIADSGGANMIWRIYDGDTAPLLESFLIPLTVTGDNSTQIYGGAPVTILANLSYSQPGVTTSGHLFNLNNPYANAINVGTYTPSFYSDQQGYDISYINAALTVTPATLTVTAVGASRVYGQANPSLTGSITGFAGSDTLANATSGSATFIAAATPASNVGSYAITESGLTANNGNYVFSSAPANATAFQITPATLTYNAAAASVGTGQTPTGLSGTVSGFVLADSQANATIGTLIWSTSASAASAPGSYPIDGNGLTATNYVFVEAPANATALTVQPASAAVVPPAMVPPVTMPVTGPATVPVVTSSSGPAAPMPDPAQTAVGTLEADLPASQTGITLAQLDLAPDTAQGDATTVVASTDGISMDKRVVIDATIPSLQIVRGGVKLPDNLVDVNAR